MDLLTSFLVENSAMKVYVSTQVTSEAITRYKCLKYKPIFFAAA
jgi:hypothetical protein